MKPHVIIIDTDIKFVYAAAGEGLVAQQGTFEQFDKYVLTPNDNACVVNPGNGRGIMGAGMAGAIQNRYGDTIAKQFKMDRKRKFGSSPAVPGYTMMTATYDPDTHIHWCAYTVTMQLPGTRIDPKANIPYHCMRNVLRAVEYHNDRHLKPINIVLASGLGTGVGGLRPEVAAIDMARAIKEWE